MHEARDGLGIVAINPFQQFGSFAGQCRIFVDDRGRIVDAALFHRTFGQSRQHPVLELFQPGLNCGRRVRDDHPATPAPFGAEATPCR